MVVVCATGVGKSCVYSKRYISGGNCYCASCLSYTVKQRPFLFSERAFVIVMQLLLLSVFVRFVCCVFFMPAKHVINNIQGYKPCRHKRCA